MLLLLPAAATAARQDTLTATPALVQGVAVYSAGLVFQTTVSPANPPATAVFTGSVRFTVDTVDLAPESVDAAGVARLAVVFSTAGTHTVSVSYLGDNNYNSSASGILSITVGKADTSLSLSSSPAQVNLPVAIRASPLVVSPASAENGGRPTGTIDFLIGTAPILGCTAVPVQNGVAVCNTTFSSLGNFQITARYNGDLNSNPSTGTLPLTVGKLLAGTYVAAAPEAPAYGTSVTLNALLLGIAGLPAPTGMITFSDGAFPLGTAPVGSDLRASLVVTSLTAGSHTITAGYSGDSTYQSSVSAPLTLTVGKLATTIAVTAGLAQVNQNVALKATVKVAGSGNPAGTVTMLNGTTPVCTGVPTDNGIATCSTKFPQLGDYTIFATYNGDTNTAVSTTSLKITVGKVVAGIYSAFTPEAPVIGAPITVNALLLGAEGVHAPTGTVAFSDGAITLSTVPVNADGRASLSTGLAIGTHNIVAAYSGDANYIPVSATPLAITVGKAATAIALSSNPPQVSQPLNIKAAVSVVAPGNAPLGGTVDFTLNTKAIAGCTGVALQNGVALCTTTLAQLGEYTIAASYSGDAGTAPSTATLPLGVGKAVPSIYTASAPSSPVYGNTVTVNALVLGAAGTAAPSGNVTFSEGTVVRGTFPLGADGRASLVAAGLSAGTHTYTAVYNGDANYASVTADPLAVTVSKAATNTVLTAAAGAPVTAAITIVSPGAGTPTGTVQFYAAGVPIGSAQVAVSGNTFVATIPAPTATGSIWAVYQGDANFAGSASQTVSVSAPPQVAISSDHNPATAGQAVTLTIRVTGPAGAAVPTGTVQISNDGASLGAAPLANGQATFPFTPTTGSHAITANYTGDSAYAAASGTFTLVVNKAAGAIGLTSSAASSVFGQPVTLTAQTSAPNGATVQFLDGTVEIGSATVSSGVATLLLSNLAVGSHSITAKWAGDAGSAPSFSPQLVQSVEKAQTSTALAVTGSNLTATVSAVAPGAGSPTGTVRFLKADTNTQVANIVVSGGVAVAPLPSTSDVIVAVYSGDAGFVGSTSTALVMLQAASAASYSTDSFAPDQLVTLFGSDLATTTIEGTGSLVAMLGGTTVSITDSGGIRHAADLLYVSPAQVNLLMPPAVATGTAGVVVTNANKYTVSTQIQVTRVAPGLFTMDGTGAGAPAGQILRVHADGTQEAPRDLAIYDRRNNDWLPAAIDLGSATDTVYLVLYGTGLRHYKGAPVCMIGDRQASVAYAGPQGAFPGLDQINIVVPRQLRGAGVVDLTFAVEGAVSNAVTLVIQ